MRLSRGTYGRGMAEHGEGFRVEHDTLGEVLVPTSAKWRAQTQRAVGNFPVSGEPMPAEVVHALALIKAAAARANAELGVIDGREAEAVRAAAHDVAAGNHDDQFPIDVFQTGSGTSTNMNVNEVVATLASDALGHDVHPNDTVNASQSSNDTFPSAVHVAVAVALTDDLLPAMAELEAALQTLSAEHTQTVKAGRTHLMDATPITFGQEVQGWAAQVGLGAERVRSALPRLCALPLGGTAVGTGVNVPAGFASRVIEELSAVTGVGFTEARDHVEAQSAQDSLVETSGQLRVLAVSLTKICNDLRLMNSGPMAGFAEIRLPDLQPGSSIMPGKVNPVVPEAVLQVCAQVIGNDATITWAGASGSFELNVMMPVMARNLTESVRLLAAACRLLARKAIPGIEVDAERMRAFAEASPAVATALNRYLGYEEVASIAKQAQRERRPVAQVVVERGHVAAGRLTQEQLEAALDVLSMTRPAQD
jgi:fumarate hydratase, class II